MLSMTKLGTFQLTSKWNHEITVTQLQEKSGMPEGQCFRNESADNGIHYDDSTDAS